MACLQVIGTFNSGTVNSEQGDCVELSPCVKCALVHWEFGGLAASLKYAIAVDFNVSTLVSQSDRLQFSIGKIGDHAKVSINKISGQDVAALAGEGQVTSIESEDVRTIGNLTVHGEWWNEFSWVECIRTVEVDKIADVEDLFSLELVEGTEADVGNEWWKTLEHIQVNWCGDRSDRESVNIFLLDAGQGLNQLLVQILQNGNVVDLFTGKFLELKLNQNMTQNREKVRSYLLYVVSKFVEEWLGLFRNNLSE